MPKIVKKNKIFFITIALLSGIILGLVIANISSQPEVSKARREVEVEKIVGEKDITSAFTKVADTVGPAVVSIYTETTHKVPGRRFYFGPEGSPFRDEFFGDFFKDFFRDVPDREYKQAGLGSGVVIDEAGYVLTNEHVVRGADKITVGLSDGREFEGTIKGTDPKSDLAVLEIKAKDLPVAELGNSDLMEIGEWVVAIGNPFGYMMRSPEPTVTVGVVSALHRTLPRRLPGYTDLIQTDAAINPGNSGGPLCDLNGKVIGINVAIFSQSGGYQGVGFAIPVNYIKGVLENLIEGKEILHGWLGVSVQDLTEDLAGYFGIEDNNGALVADVVEASPAEEGGVKEGDVIRSLNGEKIRNVDELLRNVNRAKVGDPVTLEVIRDKKTVTLTVKIGERPSEIDQKIIGEADAEQGEASWRGMTVSGITDAIVDKLKLKEKIGVVVIDIEPKSPSQKSELRRGDIIREIDRRAINNLEGFEKTVKGLKGDVLIRTERGYVIVKEE